MRLSDLFAGGDLSIYPTVATVIFGVIFLAVSIRAVRSSKTAAESNAMMPLDDGETPLAPSTEGATRG